MSYYRGSDWLSGGIGVTEVSPFGKKVADILGDTFAGIYHLNFTSLRKVEWNNKSRIIFNLGWKDLATYDYDYLTRLVVLCFDRKVRLGIEAAACKHLRLIFMCNCDDNTWSSQPTLEQSIAGIRKEYA